MRPQDFWRLTPTELSWLLDAWQPVKMYGNMPESKAAAIYRQTYGDTPS